ncbi:MAG: PhzF family phenazine biosynthesis protein [Acidobacteriota bacterium]
MTASTRYRYFICDVFTEIRFGGNPLAVLPDAAGLSSEQMQRIAREFNFSESTFVLPAEQGHTRQVRIFTPIEEVPFAGHPNIGTAFVLAAAGELGDATEVTFEEGAGLVPITIRRRPGAPIWCELEAPERLTLGKSVPPELMAAVCGLEESDIVVDTHPPRVASVGLPFLTAEVRGREALARARVRHEKLEAVRALGITPDLFVYTHSDTSATDDFDLRARMFAPLDGLPEDPATGSANCALVAMLTHFEAAASGRFSWRIAQGVEMGRPSVLEARTEKRGGEIRTWIGGRSVLVSEGWIETGPSF